MLDLAKQHNIIRTRAAVGHASEITCLIQIAQANRPAFLSSVLQTGTFVMQHRNDSVPQWLARARDVPSAKYWVSASEHVAALHARLGYRPTVASCFGLVGATSYSDNAILPRLFLHGAPMVCDSSIIEDWAHARGFARVRGAERRGRSAWIFQAIPPPSLGVTTFAFSSGITVGPLLPVVVQRRR